MQELRRPIKKEERTVNLREMEEELIVNLKKSEFLVAMATDPEDPTKVNIPYLKNKQGDILQPAFTDVMEFDKFARARSFGQPRFHLPNCQVLSSIRRRHL